MNAIKGNDISTGCTRLSPYETVKNRGLGKYNRPAKRTETTLVRIEHEDGTFHTEARRSEVEQPTKRKRARAKKKSKAPQQTAHNRYFVVAVENDYYAVCERYIDALVLAARKSADMQGITLRAVRRNGTYRSFNNGLEL